MTDILNLLKSLRRPRLLIRAARLGQVDYNRSRDLPRVLRTQALPSPGKAVMALVEKEAGLELARKEGTAGYSVVQHVDVLVAMMGEAQILSASRT